MRRPERSLPAGLIAGTGAVLVMYTLLNLVYLRALPVSAMTATPRVGEAAAEALFGAGGARLVSLAVLVSTFGCLAATILCAARIYLPVAQDGLLFRSLAHVHPRHRTPRDASWRRASGRACRRSRGPTASSTPTWCSP